MPQGGPALLDPLIRHPVLVLVSAGLLSLVAAAARWWGRPRPTATEAGGPLLLATVGGLLITHNASNWLVLSLAMLLLSGWLLTHRSAHIQPLIIACLGAGCLGVGAGLLAFGPQPVPGPLWIRAGLVAATPAVAWSLASFDQRHGSLTVPLLVLTAAGIYVTTPDTEQSQVLLAAAVGVGTISWLLAARLGSMATPALAGLILWTVAVDGRGRHAALIAAGGCLGLLVCEPLAGLLPTVRGRSWPSRGRWAGLVIFGLPQAALVAVCHEAGVTRSTWWAAASVGAILLVSVGLLLLGRAVRSPGDYRF